ncbi:hypothetical protein KIPB_014412, partial [Kipferlia bialata]|eukprot:g14412.t1
MPSQEGADSPMEGGGERAREIVPIMTPQTFTYRSRHMWTLEEDEVLSELVQTQLNKNNRPNWEE